MKFLTLALLLFGVSLIHFVTPTGNHRQHLVHVIAGQLFLLPISLAAVWFGLAGGLFASLVAAAIYLFHIAVDWKGQIGENLNQLSQIFTFFLIGLGTGGFVQLEKKLKRKAEKEKERAETDPLTKLLNRNYLETHFASELKRAKRHQYTFSVCLIDIDGFKKINDGWGHLVGDQALLHVANLIKRLKREGDIAIRFGGDEFLVLLPGARGTDALPWAEKLQSSVLKSLFRPQGFDPFPISMSVGVAEYRPETDKEESLIRRADEDLYEWKGRKR